MSLLHCIDYPLPQCYIDSGFLEFPYKFMIALSMSAKKPTEIYIESVDPFGEYCHFNNVKIPVSEHGMCFHLF